MSHRERGAVSLAWKALHATCLGWLLVLASACASTPNPQSEHLRSHQQSIRVGVTTRADIQAMLGAPSEEIHEDDVEIWVYRGKFDLPFLVGLIPVVGDVLEMVEAAQNLQSHHELIIQFDANHVVKKHKLRVLT